MQFRNSGRKNIYMNDEFQNKTYTNFPRNKSPIEEYNNNYRRSPIRIDEQGRSEYNLGEMRYYEPNEERFGGNTSISPLNHSRNDYIRSPNQRKVRNEYRNGIINISQHINRPKEIKEEKEINSREEYIMNSNKINNIESQPDDYNIMSTQRGRINNMSPIGNNRTYNMISNERGNIFLDQPIEQGNNIIQQSEEMNSSNGYIQQEANDQREQELNNREIKYNINPRDFQEPYQDIYKKMSPRGNVEGDSDSNSEKNDNVNQIKTLKNQLDRNANLNKINEDGIGYEEVTRKTRGDFDNIEVMARVKDLQDKNVGEVKKLLKYYVKTYNPLKGEDGNLISNLQMVIQPNKDNAFNYRYKVLQKMNKLSSILLAKNRGRSPSGSPDSKTISRSPNSKFDKKTLYNALSVKGTKKPLNTRRGNKFLYVSLAMLSAKGPTAEDRTILRRMRIDKGGVVDLAQEKIQNKSKFKIKKARIGGRGLSSINPKYRDKAAKIVQAWWRERKNKINKVLEQIIKIQSVWRGKFTRKYVYDIIYISFLQEKFISIMRNVLVKHTRPYVFGKIFSKKLLIKEKLMKLLSDYEEKLKYLKLKEYFLRWKNSSDIISQRIEKGKNLIDIKENVTNKISLLKKYFDKWSLISNLYKYIGKAKNAEDKKQKFFGTVTMINGLTNFTKRQVYKNTKEPISNYLKDLLRQKLLKKIVKNTNQKNIENLLKSKLNNWRIYTKEHKLYELKKDIFTKLIERISSRLDKKKLKYYFDKWRSLIPRAKKIIDINKGADIFKKIIIKNIHQEPLNAFLDKCDDVNKKESSLKLMIIKKRNLKDNLRNLFDRWKNNKIRLDDKDKRNNLYQTLLKNLINKIEKRILFNKLNKWRERPKVDLTEKMKKINDFTQILQKIFKNYYSDDYEDFLNKLEKTRDDHALKRAGKIMLKKYKKKDDILLRYYIYKWRSKIKDEELKDLHLQLLKFLINSLELKNDRNNLHKYFTRWRLFVGDGKNYDNLEKLKLAMKGGDILQNIYHRRLRFLFYKLYQKMTKNYKPLILGRLIKKMDKPRSTIRECFDRWRRLTEKEKDEENIKTYKAKIMNINSKNINNRSNRDKLMKYFNHWKIMSKNPKEYYLMVKKFLDTLANTIKINSSAEPFEKIKDTINPTRNLLKIISNKKNLEKNALRNKLCNMLGRWRKISSDIGEKNIKTKIIYNLRFYLKESLKKILLSKYLTIWDLKTRKRGLNLEFVKGIDKLTEIFKAPSRKLIYDIFMDKIKNALKLKGANDIYNATNKIKNNLLHNVFLNWWKNCMKIDPLRMTKIRTKITKIIKYNEKQPILQAFYTWFKNVQYSKLKDKDIYHASKLIENITRNNDKTNMNNALSRWKKQIHLLKEQYLKSLLIKKIKSSQDLKENLNESRLRNALLKWRAYISSLDYLNRINKIKRGCKSLKLAIRKLHEQDIIDELKNIAKEDKKKEYLDNIINEINPKLNKYHLNKAINIWKDKLGDTNRMKNKLKGLLENYIHSEKLHKGLFEEPKNNIIDALNKCNERKEQEAQKIADFFKKIQRIPEYIRKSKTSLLLSRIVNKKSKLIKDLKKINLIRLYRQTQKVKNDENAKIIQHFIKKKLKKYLDKKGCIARFINILESTIKRKCLNKFNDILKRQNFKKVMKKYIKKIEINNGNTLKEKLKQWKEKLPLLEKIQKVIKIQKIIRSHNTKKKMDNIKDRQKLMFKIINNIEEKNKKLLGKYIHDWLRRSLVEKNHDNARIIQNFCRNKMNNYKYKMSILKLIELSKRNVKHKLAKLMEKAARIIGDKGEVLYKALEDIIVKRPFDKFINNLKFEGKINTLRDIQPSIHDKVAKYHLSKALKKWKENTYDQTVKYSLLLQKFLRDQYEKKMKKDKESREFLLSLFLKKLIKNDLYNLQLPFNIWQKNAKLDKIEENATKIQNKFREFLSKNKLKDIKISDKFIKLVKIIKTKEKIIR